MAPNNAHFNNSAAVEYVQFQWKSINNRAHYIMQNDGSIVLVDPNHLATQLDHQAGDKKASIKAGERSGLDNITKNKPIILSSSSIPPKHRGHKRPSIDDKKEKPRHTVETISSAAKRRNKVPETARSGFSHILKKKPIIPETPSALPGNKNPQYEYVSPRYEQTNARVNRAKWLISEAQQARVRFDYTKALQRIQEFELIFLTMFPELMNRPAWKLRLHGCLLSQQKS